MTLKPSDIERAELAKFNPAKLLSTMEDVRLRLATGHVVYQHQFVAFIDAYDKLRKWLERMEDHKKYLGAWAMTHKPSIERYEKQQAEARRKYYESLGAA